MLKYTKIKYNSTRKFYFQHIRKTVFESNNNNHNDDDNEEVANDYICPFCKLNCEYGESYGGHVVTHKKEPNYKEIIAKARNERNAKKNSINNI